MKLIPLICTQCGAKLEREDAGLFVADSTVIVLSSGGFVCEHCGTKFAPGDEVKMASDVLGSAFDQRGQTVGQQINVVGGHVGVVGNGVTIKGGLHFG